MHMISEVPDTGRGVSSRQAGSDDYLTPLCLPSALPTPSPKPKGFGGE